MAAEKHSYVHQSEARERSRKCIRCQGGGRPGRVAQYGTKGTQTTQRLLKQGANPHSYIGIEEQQAGMRGKKIGSDVEWWVEKEAERSESETTLCYAWLSCEDVAC